jgi:hypothetical protein
MPNQVSQIARLAINALGQAWSSLKLKHQNTIAAPAKAGALIVMNMSHNISDADDQAIIATAQTSIAVGQQYRKLLQRFNEK